MQIDLCDREEVGKLKALLERALELTEPASPPATDQAGSDEPTPAGFMVQEVEDLAHPPKFQGRGHLTKYAVWRRMKLYRMDRGLGCWHPLAKLLDNRSDDWVRSVYLGEIAVPINDWRQIDRALDKLGAPGANDEEETPC